jgi:hypothetical protein
VPPPDTAKYKNRKQKSTANTPPLSIGKKPCGVRHEIGESDLARHYQRHDTGEQADQQQRAAHQLDHPGEPEQRDQLQLVEHCDMWKSEELCETVLQNHKCGDDPEHAEHSLRPPLIEDCHWLLSFGSVDCRLPDQEIPEKPMQQDLDARILFLFRHGETDWNREGRLQGHTNTALNATGLAQATMLSETLRPHRLDAVVSSDLARARTTAQIVAEALDIPLFTDAGCARRMSARPRASYGRMPRPVLARV